MQLARPLVLVLSLAPLALTACASSDPAPQSQPAAPPPAAAPAQPAAQPAAPEVAPTAAAEDPDAIPEVVYATPEELDELYGEEITGENLDAILDQIEAELEAESAGNPD